MIFVECAFVNSETPPIVNKKISGYWVEERIAYGEAPKLVLYEFYQEEY